MNWTSANTNGPTEDWGASPENRERLYRLTLAELDRLEVALGKVDGAAIRAEEPRDEAYDADDVGALLPGTEH